MIARGLAGLILAAIFLFIFAYAQHRAVTIEDWIGITFGWCLAETVRWAWRQHRG